jgi:hypothetical protein
LNTVPTFSQIFGRKWSRRLSPIALSDRLGTNRASPSRVHCKRIHLRFASLISVQGRDAAQWALAWTGRLSRSPCVNSVTRDGIAANSRNMTAEMTPGAVAKLARYSCRDNPRTHSTPAISAGANIPSATRPIGIVEPRVWCTSKRRITHRAEMIIAMSMKTALMSRAARWPSPRTSVVEDRGEF